MDALPRKGVVNYLSSMEQCVQPYRMIDKELRTEHYMVGVAKIAQVLQHMAVGIMSGVIGGVAAVGVTYAYLSGVFGTFIPGFLNEMRISARTGIQWPSATPSTESMIYRGGLLVLVVCKFPNMMVRWCAVAYLCSMARDLSSRYFMMVMDEYSSNNQIHPDALYENTVPPSIESSGGI